MNPPPLTDANPPPLTDVNVMNVVGDLKSVGFVHGDMSALTNATTKVPAQRTSDIQKIVNDLCSICPQNDCIKIISESMGEQQPRHRITKSLVIERDKNYFQMIFPNKDDEDNTIGPHFLMGKRKRQKMRDSYNKTSDDEKPLKYNYDLYDEVKSLAEKGIRYKFYNRSYLKRKKPPGTEAAPPRNETELFKIKIICDAAAVAKMDTPKPVDVLEQLIALEDLHQSLYQSTLDYVKRIVTSYFSRCHKFTTSNINITAFNGGYDEIRKVICNNFVLVQLLAKCTTIVKRFVTTDEVFKHLFEQAMKWRLLKIKGNDAVLTERRTQPNNFYADILTYATDNVYNTANRAITNFVRKEKKNRAMGVSHNAIINAVPYHHSKSATIVTTPSSDNQQTVETSGSANVSATAATIFEGQKEDDDPPAMKSTISSFKSVTADDGDNNGGKGGMQVIGETSIAWVSVDEETERVIVNKVDTAVVNVETENRLTNMVKTVTAVATCSIKETMSEHTMSRRLFSPSALTASASAKASNKAKTTIGDAYSADEQQHIDESFNATLKIDTENRSEDFEHTYTKDYYCKRVWKNDPTNKSGCWGTVVRGYYEEVGVRGYYDNRRHCRWTVHFDDNTISNWNSEMMWAGRDLYETKKTKDPSKRPLELRSLHPSPEDLEIFEYEIKEKGTDDDCLLKNCKSVLYDPSLYTVAQWKSISRDIGTTEYSKWIAVDDYWAKRGVCPNMVLLAASGGPPMTEALTHKQKVDVRFELIGKNNDNEGHEGQPSFFDMFNKKDTDESQRICQIFYDCDGDARLLKNDHKDAMVVGIPKLYFGVAKSVKGKKKGYGVVFIDDDESDSYTRAQYNAGRLLYEKTKQIYEQRHGGGPDVPTGSFLRYEIEHSLDQRVKIRKVTNGTIGRKLIGGDKNTALFAYHFGTIVNVELDENDPNEAKVTIMYDIGGEKDDTIPWRDAHLYIYDYNDHYDEKFPRSNCLRNRETETKGFHLEVARTEPLKDKKNDPRLCHETKFCNYGDGGGADGSKMIHCKDMKGFNDHVNNANCYLSFDGHCILKDDGSFPSKHHLKASSGNRQKLLERINKERDDMNDEEPNRHHSSIDRSFQSLRRPMLDNGTVAYYCQCDTCVKSGEPVCICYRCFKHQKVAVKGNETKGGTIQRLDVMLDTTTNGYGDNRSLGGLRSEACTARQIQNARKRKERS